MFPQQADSDSSWEFQVNFFCRIDHLIDRLGKGGYDKHQFGSGNKENNKKENVGIMLPCEVRSRLADHSYHPMTHPLSSRCQYHT